MTVPVLWLSLRDDVPPRGYWDSAILDALFDGHLWTPPNWPGFSHHTQDDYDPARGHVVVIPGTAHVDLVPEINATLAPMPWALVIIHADESSTFPIDALDHPNLAIWVQSPRSDRHARADRLLPFGWPTDTPDILKHHFTQSTDKPVDWFAAFQATNPLRWAWAKMLDQFNRHDGGNGELITSDGFAKGLDRGEYLERLASARIAPCPGGMVTPDTLRVWEALEAGCYPLVGTAAGEWEVPEYWNYLLGEHPLRLVPDAAQLRKHLLQAFMAWPANVNRVGAWWQDYKRQLAYDLCQTVTRMSGVIFPPTSPDDLITVVIPTSPIPSHPSTTILSATIDSVRKRLPTAEILLTFDGVRPEQSYFGDAYEEYQRQVHILCRTQWHNVLPIRQEAHVHQANLTHDALGQLTTPLVLFVEHDCPLTGDIPFADLAKVVLSERANVIRLHHEAQVLDVHRHLMVGDGPEDIDGVPLWPTMQWSQRPHLASADYYRMLLDAHFDLPKDCWFIEDKLHGAVQDQPWEANKIFIYTPEGDIKRSLHLDGREGQPKWVDT